MRGLQIITKDYIRKCAELTPQERLDWLEEYKLLIPVSAYEERIEEAKRKGDIISGGQKYPLN